MAKSPDTSTVQAAKDYLDLYRGGVAKTNTVLWSVTLSMIVIWLSVVEGTFDSLSDLQSKHDRIGEFNDKYQQVSGEKRRLTETIRDQRAADNKKPSSITLESILTSPEGEKYNTLIGEQKYFRDFQAATRAEIDKKVGIGLFGTDFLISRKVVCLVWMILVAWLVAYLNIRRRQLSQLVVKTASLGAKSASNGTTAIAGDPPFWLAPIARSPTLDRESVELIRTALGWDDSTYRLATRLALITGLGLIVVACRVFYISFLITDEVIPSGIGEPLRWFLNVSVVIAFIWLVIQVLTWSYRAVAEVPQLNFFDPVLDAIDATVNGTRKVSRRKLLFEGTCAGATCFGLGFLSAKAIGWSNPSPEIAESIVLPNLVRVPKNPRYKARQSSAISVGKEEGFYPWPSSPRTRYVYVDSLGRARLPERSDTNLASDIDSNLGPATTRFAGIVPNLLPRDSAFAIEQAAIHALSAGNGDAESLVTASQVLSDAVEQPFASGSPGFVRHLDLLATIYARQNRIDELEQLAQKVRSTSKLANDRVAKWLDANGKWRTVRANSASRVKWRWVDRDGKYHDIEIKYV
ncbi:hypothetical protein [Rhizobium leguminosarum]|uniref:hypothetical protein n=1 Tax=Rhizobium leguminosarum TaxID=384 RepID=UPI001C983DB8|nr:hypothetical protein [Rhizobium leguminosarum]MBY5585068.1 hypothetical protein [Rhizobium leguminosarum]